MTASAARRRPHIDPLIAALLIALGVLIMIIGVQKPGVFFLPVNILNIGQAITMLGLIALAETVVIIMGGLDLSAGSIVGLVSILIALAMRDNNNIFVGIAAGLAAGALAGMFNGLLITKGPDRADHRYTGHDGGVSRVRLHCHEGRADRHHGQGLQQDRLRKRSRHSQPGHHPDPGRGGLLCPAQLHLHGTAYLRHWRATPWPRA